MEPVIEKDGILQVYTDCPKWHRSKGPKCEGYVQESLGGPGPEPITVYRCNRCNTEYSYDELHWRPATQQEIKHHKSDVEFREAWRQDETQAYLFATWWAFERPDKPSNCPPPSYETYLSFAKHFHRKKKPLSEEHFKTICWKIYD